MNYSGCHSSSTGPPVSTSQYELIVNHLIELKSWSHHLKKRLNKERSFNGSSSFSRPILSDHHTNDEYDKDIVDDDDDICSNMETLYYDILSLYHHEKDHIILGNFRYYMKEFVFVLDELRKNEPVSSLFSKKAKEDNCIIFIDQEKIVDNENKTEFTDLLNYLNDPHISSTHLVSLCNDFIISLNSISSILKFGEKNMIKELYNHFEKSKKDLNNLEKKMIEVREYLLEILNDLRIPDYRLHWEEKLSNFPAGPNTTDVNRALLMIDHLLGKFNEAGFHCQSVGYKKSFYSFFLNRSWRNISMKAHIKQWLLLMFTILFIILLLIPTTGAVEERNCFAILIFVSLLWATEIIPLFVTAFLVPFFAISLRVLRDPINGYRLNTADAAAVIFSSMFSHVILLLLGGFTMAAALNKYSIAEKLSLRFISKFSTFPSRLIFCALCLSAFLSLWISNVAAPSLCFSILHPVIHSPTIDNIFPKAVIMAIAMGANIGGMGAPISSPQNLFAIELMGRPVNNSQGQPITQHHTGLAPSWLLWLTISVPVCMLSLLGCWFLIKTVYRTHYTRKFEIIFGEEYHKSWTKEQFLVLLVTGMTLILWCCGSFVNQGKGLMGIISIVPILILFGSGILTKEDFHKELPWTIIFLAMGGLALGESVRSSGLLRSMSQSLSRLIQGYSMWFHFFLIAIFILIVSTFISHTVSAIILLPMIQSLAAHASMDPHPQLFVLLSAFLCSAGMALPISGFPNMTASAQEREDHESKYLHAGDFFRIGLPCSLIVFTIIISVGFGLGILLDL